MDEKKNRKRFILDQKQEPMENIVPERRGSAPIKVARVKGKVVPQEKARYEDVTVPTEVVPPPRGMLDKQFKAIQEVRNQNLRNMGILPLDESAPNDLQRLGIKGKKCKLLRVDLRTGERMPQNVGMPPEYEDSLELPDVKLRQGFMGDRQGTWPVGPMGAGGRGDGRNKRSKGKK